MTLDPTRIFAFQDPGRIFAGSCQDPGSCLRILQGSLPCRILVGSLQVPERIRKGSCPCRIPAGSCKDSHQGTHGLLHTLVSYCMHAFHFDVKTLSATVLYVFHTAFILCAAPIIQSEL